MSDFEDPLLAAGAEEEDNWLVSYADLLTNLLAFFVMLFAISNVTQSRWEMLSGALSKKNDQKGRAGVVEIKQRLDAFIAAQGLEHEIATQLDSRGLEVRFRTTLLFASADAELSPAADRVLSPVAQALASLANAHEITVEGHADDLPIRTLAFASNWELSAKRSVNVVRRLIDRGVPKEWLSAEAFADTRPIAAGTDETARANNRRVIVRVR
jgi:chemotaxis protein MotB